MNSLIKEIKDNHDVLPRGQEGQPHSHWVLLDYADILVNIFHPDARRKYAVENLHKDKDILYPGPDWEFPEPADLSEEEQKKAREEFQARQREQQERQREQNKGRSGCSRRAPNGQPCSSVAPPAPVP